MATDNLLSSYLISATIQSGDGVPNHIGTKETIYIDRLTGISYQNKDNVNTWLKFLYEGDASGAGGISGGGTINYIPKWSSTSGLTNSRIFDDGILITLGGNTSVIGSLSATTYYGDGSNLTGIPYITGGTYISSAGTLTMYNKAGGSFNVTGTYSFENKADKQNSMNYDGTGIKYPTVDAVNILTNNIARAVVHTGFIDTSDKFTLYVQDNITLGISGSSGGIVFSELFNTPPFAPSSAIVQLTSRIVPLSLIGLTEDSNVIRFVGYNQSTDSIIFSETSFIQSPNTCQLGVVMVKYTAGVHSFIDIDRSFINQPDIAGYNNLETTGFGLKSNVVVNNLANNLRIKNSAGNLIGISTNWHGPNNDLLPISESDITGTTFTYIYPGNSITATPPTIAFLIDPTQYWNGTALVAIPNNNNATIQRFMVTIRGTIVVQYGETVYADFITASNNATVQSFTDILPAGTAIEIGRLVTTKNTTDLSDNTKVIFITTGGGGGGSSSSNITTWGTIQGNIFDQTDLVDNFQLKLTNPVTGTGSGTTNTLTKWNSPSGITDSNISDDGTTVTISSNVNIVGSITGNSFVVSGGSSNDFIKGDGSTDSTKYTDGIFKQNITVVLSGGKTMGKYLNGQIIPASGKTFEEVIRDIAIEYVNPAFTSFSVSSQNTTVEVGTTLSGSKTFTWGITINSGTVPTIDIYDNTTSTTLLAATPNDGTQAQIITTKQLNADGTTQSWKGIANNTNPIGTVSSGNFIVTSRFYRFWAPVAAFPSNTTDGVANRTYAFALPNNAFKTSGVNTFTMATGTIQNKFIVLLPPSVTITSVIDQTNANTDVTANYILSTITINDVGGTARIYNMYQYVNAIPYTTSANHFITTT